MLNQLKDTLGKAVLNPDAKDASMKVLVGTNEGWNHVMRVFELEVGGYTPKHTHDWPHINYVLEGTGVLFLNGVENKVEAGSYAYIPSNELHQFKNVGNSVFKFICIVPSESHK
jgi:quercetin dioxygenase-like cupin family protein